MMGVTVLTGNSSLVTNVTECPPGSLLDYLPVRVPLIFCYVMVFLCCSLGNLLLLAVVSIQRSMRSATNFFLANLAFADLLVAVFCILQNLWHLLLSKHAHWPLGATACHLYVFVLHLVPSVSSGLLILVSIERYVAVLHPMTAREVLTKKLLATLTVAVWTTAVLANIPHILSTKHYEWVKFASCSRKFYGPINLGYLHLANFLLFYCVPLATMIFMYTRIGKVLWSSTLPGNFEIQILRHARNSACAQDKEPQTESISLKNSPPTKNSSPPSPPRKTRFESLSTAPVMLQPQIRSIKSPLTRTYSSAANIVETRKRIVVLLIAVVLCFALMTLPHHVRMIWLFWKPFQMCNSSPVVLFQPISYLLLFLNSGINPFLYAFFSQRFRAAVKQTFACERRSREFANRSNKIRYIPPRPENLNERSEALL